jgi:hypothetical protein
MASRPGVLPRLYYVGAEFHLGEQFLHHLSVSGRGAANVDSCSTTLPIWQSRSRGVLDTFGAT